MVKRKNKTAKDQGLIENIIFNDPAGGQKNVSVGPVLEPIFANGAYTTNLTSATPVYGCNLAVYNNSGSLHTITFGDSGVTVLGPGATNSSGFVGVPCPPNQWTYLSAGENTHAIASSAALLVFRIRDE